ncbi:hypothetical protein OH76DRAFT_1386908 [Lentinus brumalis]|uniref:DUF4139 domain-containing protein n=1 Tax=Lentinus brumalis TaxID=2498619 RepID=A0A371D181_9APHY|nr:hypothetical protein OH76DRAFT_1386908 [Polyporus brumalis]
MLSKTIDLEAADHLVKSVTIFQSSKAEVTRTFKVNLQSGRNTVQVSGLSSNIDQGSPRIHTPHEEASVFDICCEVTRPTLMTPTAKAEELDAKKQELVAERSIQREEYAALNEALHTPVKTGSELDGLLESILVRKRRATKTILEADRELGKIEREISLLGKGRKGAATGTVSATVLAKHECEVEILLTYLVSGVSWTPSYDLRAVTTSDGKTSSTVALHYFANINQSTGEDWTDAALTLSTANSRTLESLSVPTAEPLKISSVAVAPPSTTRYRSPSPRRYRHGSSPAGRERYYGGRPSRLPIVIRDYGSRRASVSRERERVVSVDYEIAPAQAETVARGTTVDRNPLALSYRVDGRASLPSDGLAHKISLATLHFAAGLQYVCVPRKETSAFIEASIKNTSEYQLLAGPVSVFVDNGFVTKTLLQLVNVGESFTCVLGVDTALKISYKEQSRTDQDAVRNFVDPTKTTTRMVTTIVMNGHVFEIAGVIVRDAIPLGDADAKVKVTLQKPEGLAAAKDGEDVSVDSGSHLKDVKVRWTSIKDGEGGEKDGLYEWVCSIPAGEEVVLQTEWAVKGPADVEWEEWNGKKHQRLRLARMDQP